MALSTWWDEQVLPRVVDVVLHDRITAPWRAAACALAGGEVLELGFGSGRNLPFYGDDVCRVLAVEPSELAWRQSQQRRAAARFPVHHVGLDGARLDLPDHSVDSVVTTWTLCTIPDLAGALGEVRRVLRPGGALSFAEHSIAPDRLPARAARALQPGWGLISGGCRLDRDIPAEVLAAGLRTSGVHAAYVSRAVPFGYFVRGSAH